MSFPRYQKYKDSGVEWLGDLPGNWSIIRAKYLFQERDERSVDGAEDLYALSKLRGLVPRSEISDKEARADTLEGYKRFHPGDLVMNKMQAWNGIFGSTETCSGIVSPDYSVFSRLNPVSLRFYTELFRTPLYAGVFQQAARGMGTAFLRLNSSDFGATFLPLPPVIEQALISTFLDRETARIDALIATQRRLIDLLREKRSALISHAVTKGLDPNVKMKDSGVEWLGMVPEGWRILALKHVVSMNSGEQITFDNIEDNGEFPVFGGNGFRGYTSSYTHDGYFPLIGRQGALCGNINYAHGKFWASEHAVVVLPKIQLSIVWLGELLRVMNLGQYSVTAAQPGLSVEVIGNLHIPLPPSADQDAIAAFLDRETAKIDALISQSEKSITLAQERRSALISAAVTGKIDVRKEMK